MTNESAVGPRLTPALFRTKEMEMSDQSSRRPPPDQPERGRRGPPRTLLAKLIEIGRKGFDQFFQTPHGEPFARLVVGEHVEDLPVLGERFGRCLLMKALRKDILVGQRALREAQEALAALAHDGPSHPVSLRVAVAPGCVYLDQGGGADSRIVQVTPSGWQPLSSRDCPVRFRRTPAMLALPLPERGGSLAELWSIFPLAPAARTLIAGWSLDVVRGIGPHPILALTGEQGTGKSLLARCLVSLIDPQSPALRSPPRDERDLVAAARRSRIIAIDNLSGLSVDQSDAYCRSSSGAGVSLRKLFSDGEEFTYDDGARPILFTSITDVVVRGDLSDRTLHVGLERIVERKAEAELWAKFEAARPRILGALLDAVAGALRELSAVRAQRLDLPRMADHALWVTAAESTLGWPPGTYLAALDANRREAASTPLEGSLLILPLLNLLRDQGGSWRGPAQHLLSELERRVDEVTRRRESWPRHPRQLADELRRLAPSMRSAHGVEIDSKRTKAARVLSVTSPQRRHRQLSLARPASLSCLDEDDDSVPTPSLTQAKGRAHG